MTPTDTNKSTCPSTGEATKHGPIDVEPTDLESSAVAESRRENRICAFENRLEIAEYSIAIAESVKLWMAYVPWRVNVLWDGTDVLSWLRAEEEVLPWPPEPETDADNEVPAQAEQCLDDDSIMVGPMPLEACDSGGPRADINSHYLRYNQPVPGDESSFQNAEDTAHTADQSNATVVSVHDAISVRTRINRRDSIAF